MKGYYRKHFLGCELFISFVFLGIVMFISYFWLDNNYIVNNLNGIRDTFYGATASITGALLGFVITGLSVLLTMNTNNAIEHLKKSRHFPLIFKIFLSTSKYLALSLFVSLLSLLFDKDTSPVPLMTFITLWSIIIVVFRLTRCFWVLEKIINLQK
jgi:hypothetical protein